MDTKFREGIKKLLIDLNIYDENINIDTFCRALTHSTYANEHKNVKDFQYLEFLGDSILQFLVSKEIYRLYPEYKEGRATQHRSYAVNNKTLSEVSEKIGLSENILFSKNAFLNGKNEKINSDFFEAFIAAIYLEKGLDFTDKFIKKHLKDYLLNEKIDKDPKTTFQELIQLNGSCKIIYKTDFLEELGKFQSAIIVDNKKYGIGFGKTKKEAKENAAKNALKSLNV
ncbi:ribonuclease III [Metamycoplasma hyosynoviae]|uniref:ribonuclease III n=1 Tax=Metamycoplasma hyosynoviae TaxID=29559 RepID=UPI0023592A98|nr:ribonuclease III [Metamycoplasma hyosynoviae]MDC8920470.1 ribonuclease III [Metamycoplasma hyosynoviae]MDC8962493.1 ribonuclease III [Metamycoplasma hyosynoviae]MDD7837567.1 ribonuclease III [Metamycoplasma hyosynoviae]MDD7895175.1 ribonuclease III [Metamycoplasma hyosynoviae]MDD7897871.1 ribonuclease III [Metamycoplasma hyosynoviae]